MQWGSTGVRGFAGRASSLFNKGGGSGGGMPARALHTHVHLPHPQVPLIPTAARPSPSTAQTFAKHTRTLVSRFVAHLTTPGTLRSPSLAPEGAGRALHSSAYGGGAATRPTTIRQRLSLPAQHALGRPLGAPHLPRPPAIPRSTTHVGLGTARAFHSGRPIFASLAENVPVAARALYEAEWDLRKKERMGAMKRGLPQRQEKAKAQKRRELVKENGLAKKAQSAAAKQAREDKRAELERYFAPAPAVGPSSVSFTTTTLLIPLAPTPTSRYPLAPLPSDAPLLPRAALVALHTDHARHQLRVSALFARLDAAQVWDAGVQVSSYGDLRGRCTVLCVTFGGWTREQVQAVIGEAGRGWCEFVEELEVDETHGANEDGESLCAGETVDVAHSFVFPMLDFSSSFLAAHPSPGPSASPLFSPTTSNIDLASSVPPSPAPRSPPLQPIFSPASTFAFPDLDLDAHSGTDSDGFSDFSLSSGSSGFDDLLGYPTADVLSPAPGSPASTATSWIGLGFSSRFAARMDGAGTEETEPREYMF